SPRAYQCESQQLEGRKFMSTSLNGKTIAFLVAPEGVEQVELTEPWKAVEKAGLLPQLISTQSGKVQGYNHLDKAQAFAVDADVNDVSATDFEALVLPGVGSPTQTFYG